MAEYIDREEYCEKHCRCSNEYCDRVSCPIWKAPAADVAPVVRCMDCKHLVSVNVNGKGIPTCRVSGMEVAPDEFCSRGEKGRR